MKSKKTSFRSQFGVLDHSRAFLIIILALCGQNLIIFWNHYFQGHGFPWDFPREYYAVVAFWTNAAQHGIFPQWNPFSSMGMPFLLHLQTGIFYLPLWVFPIFRLPYSLHNAVVFQALHVLFGSLGMYLFLREKTNNRLYAFLGAFIFQFFGGFYSNAEHVDIIRGFAYTPWMLYLFTIKSHINGNQGLLTQKKFLLIPIFVYLFVTGSYPGNYLAGIFLIMVYVVIQVLFQMYPSRQYGQSIKQLTVVSALSLLGILISAVYLGPIIIGRDYIGRFLVYQDLERMNFSLAYLPSLIFSNRRLPGEISMNSLFITVPAFILLFSITQRSLRNHAADAFMLFFSGLLSFGSSTFIWKIISKVLFPLQISRFPSSDYRAFFAVFLILFGILGLHTLRNGGFTYKQLAFRAFLSLLLFLQFVDMVYQLELRQIIFAALAGLLTWSLIVGFKLAKNKPILQHGLLLIFVAIIFADGLHVLQAMKSQWINEEMEQFYLEKLDSNVVDRFTNPPATRPIREPEDNQMYWEGYLSGVYNSGAPCLLKTCGEIHKNPVYVDYMLRSWTPILLNDTNADPGQVEDAIRGLTSGTTSLQVQQVRYGINEIVYKVNLEQPALMIENEVYFPGWEGSISGSGKEKLNSVPIAKIFRGWNLPAGEYEIRTRFAYPNLNAFATVSAVGLFVWILLVIMVVLQDARKSKLLYFAHKLEQQRKILS